MALSGCDLLNGNGENFPPEPDIEHYTIIVNNSNHIVDIHRYFEGELFHTIIIGQSKKWEFKNELFKEQLPFFPEIADSVQIFYDGSISVWNTKDEVQPVDRSMLLVSSYTGGKVNDKLYEIYYTFTDEDYEEAVALNGGG